MILYAQSHAEVRSSHDRSRDVCVAVFTARTHTHTAQCAHSFKRSSGIELLQKAAAAATATTN